MQQHNNGLNENNSPKDTNLNNINPAFDFDKYIGVDDIKTEAEQLLKKCEAPQHAEILNQLIEQFEPLDFELLAFPQAE